ANAQSGGALKIEVRDGTTLASFANVYQRVTDDAVQIGWAILPVLAGRFPRSEVGTLPFLTDDAVAASAPFWQPYKSGILDPEYKDIVPLALVVHTQYQIHLSKKPKATEDLSGLKIIAFGKTNAKVVELLGGTPISLGPQDVYEALQRGTVDGAMISWSSFAPYKLGEVSSFHVEVPFGTTTSGFFMARAKYESLTANARKALEENAGESFSRAVATHLASEAAKAREPISASSQHTIVRLKDEQIAQWRDKTTSAVAEWTKGRPDGEKVLERYREIYAQVKGIR